MNLLQTLLKENTDHNESINRYNLWFIKLRWYAVAALISFVITLKYLFGIGITSIQFYSYAATTLFIAVYNFYFQQKYMRSITIVDRAQNYSLYQIILDLFFLSILIYFSGGIEAPIFLLYIFHMIIGSMILPEKFMYIIASILILFLSLFTTLEYFNFIQHQTLNGLYPFQLYKSANFVIGFLTLFSFVMLMSIKLTSRIVNELYSRESQLRRALKDVNDAEISKQKYLMAVVHELKSPIAAASSNLDLVLGKFVGEVSESALEKLSRSKERLAESITTINSILRFSQFRLINKLELETISLALLIEEVVSKNRSLAERKKIKIVYETKDKYEYEGDKVLLSLAFSNLISNAVKYTQENGNVKIEVVKNEINITVLVYDDGLGIPSDDLPKIFEEYYRASNVKGIEGTGTGLSTIKKIVESHKGIINVNSPSRIGSKTRPGTEFQITFPIK
ncbi:MAG: HAMP domain-containing sensor histidine kinase [Melioribacteraceae bacterium]